MTRAGEDDARRDALAMFIAVRSGDDDGLAALCTALGDGGGEAVGGVVGVLIAMLAEQVAESGADPVAWARARLTAPQLPSR